MSDHQNSDHEEPKAINGLPFVSDIKAPPRQSVYSIKYFLVVVANNLAGCKMFEIVHVGRQKLIGEIIRLKNSKAFIQCYENTAGLRLGDPVIRTKQPLSVMLGPGILENIFDGVQRPLTAIHEASQNIFIPKGIHLVSLNTTKLYPWFPSESIKLGDTLSGGDIIGFMEENSLFKKHMIMIPPKISGKLVMLKPAGTFNIEEVLAELKTPHGVTEIKAYHYWPVREPRPTVEKLEGDSLLYTGQRVLDALFPSIRGGTCSIPGAFGCGKTCVSQAVSKYSNCDVVTYVGCGERGNEMAEVLSEFPSLTTRVNGKNVNVMLRTILIANTSNMPVAAREASIYTGICISEYYRDMGYNVVMLADSTSRWAEALREISGRLSEMPADNGYPAYLGGRLASFYERAGKAVCVGNPKRKGSISIIGAVSPPGGDFSDPVTVSTMNITQVFWGLDKKLAQRKHFPSVNWNKSYSNYLDQLKQFFTNFDPHFLDNRRKIAEILHKDMELQEIVQLIGKDSLSETSKLVLDVAKIIREDFLQQNAFSDYDYNCPLEKTAGMMHIIVMYYESINNLLQDTSKNDQQLSLAVIKGNMKGLLNNISAMKFQDPAQSPTEFKNYFDKLKSRINEELKKLKSL
ncbi:V-type proton ATPase catalytic subunit A-like [Dermatophagoides farinae]|uniref:V-type proton ATPase catalytic subunit A-like n=1 Tax=Dermatophagoides farinae TaxID=6954 RepID=UPI003F61A576